MDKYNKNFFTSHQTGSKKSAQKIVPIIINLFNPKSVVDVGCGTGDWLSVFLEKDVVDVVGMDGTYVDKNLLSIPVEHFIPTDLEQSIVTNRKFDLAMSLEVAEHLSPQRAQEFVKDLVSLAPIVLFSAAIPGQGGTNHLNEQWPTYWKNIFNQNNYIAFDIIRSQIWGDENIEWWYAQNIIIYVNKSVVNNYPSLRVNFSENDGVMSIVHPRLYSKVNLNLSKNIFLVFMAKIIRLFSQ